MFGRYEVSEDLVQITLPSGADVSRPFGFPVNVYLLKGDAPALISTGLPAAREALVAALRECELRPEDIAKVLVTSALPESVGNADIFTRASVQALASGVTLDVAAAQAALRDEIEPIARELVDGADGHASWSHDDVDRFVGAYFSDQPTGLSVVPLSDGMHVRAADRTLTAYATPGADQHAGCFFDEDASRLYGGETVVRSPLPRIRDPKAYTESLTRMSRLTPGMILPGYGGVERSYFAMYRALNLSVANLVQNLPFALHGPTSVAAIAHNDIGYWPRDVIRFASTVLRFKVMLDELVVSGVAQKEGEGPWAVYSMDRPSRH